MAGTSQAQRVEKRTGANVLVELHSFDNGAFEITNTVNVSQHGAQIVSRTFWLPNQRVSIRMIRGGVSSPARIVYCRPSKERTFAVGLQFQDPMQYFPTNAEPQ